MTMKQDTLRYQSFAIGEPKNRWIVPTDGAEICLVSMELQTTIGAAVITIYRSLDGITPAALESAQTLSAAAMSATIDSAGFPFLILQLSTTGTAATFANLNVTRSRSV